LADDTQSSGGFTISVPMPFRQSMRVTTDADPDYYHVTYRAFADADGVATFDPRGTATDVLTSLQQAGSRDPKPAQPGAVNAYDDFQLMPGRSATVASAGGSGLVTGLRLRIPHLTHPTTTPRTDDGRAFGPGGSSTFTLALDPANSGVQLTRRYDPGVGNQRATVLVDGTAVAQWAPVPATAPGSWADQTVTLPASATAGKSTVTVTNAFAASDNDVNEFAYTATQRLGGVWQPADTVDVGPLHTATEAAHRYSIRNQTWSGGRTFSYPLPAPVSDDGRAYGTGGGSRFTLAIDPANSGVRLTRRLDPSVGGQVAAVSVDGVPAGSWAANPGRPIGTWLDESIDLPAPVTRGRSRITVANAFTGSGVDINEFTYFADSHVGTGFARTDTLDVGNPASESAHGYAITGQTWTGTREFRYPADDSVLDTARIRFTFDGTRTVDAPLGQFFGSGGGTVDTRTLLSSIDGDTLSSWWPMPYGQSMSVELYNASGWPLSGEVALTTAADPHWRTDLDRGAAGYFQATAHAGATVAGQDWSFLNAKGHGKVVGVVQAATGTGGRGYLEGDERVYTDGSASPQIHGTGTEDFYGGGWYFNHGPFTDPLQGNTWHEAGTGNCPPGADCTGMYRLLLADAVPFHADASFGIEHGGADDVPATYSSTTFWYGQGAPAATETDRLTVGDPDSERAHAYTATDPGPVVTRTGTYEGNDGPPAPLTRTTRATTAAVTFTMVVDPANAGILLRRTSDQTAAYQTADVTVNGVHIGQWQQPLGNTYHRWLDDEYLVPASVTAGQSRLTITLTPVPGWPAWSAASYRTSALHRP
jgi:hypothetical protein